MSVSRLNKLEALKRRVEQNLAAMVDGTLPESVATAVAEEWVAASVLLRLEKRWEQMLRAQIPEKVLDVQRQAAQGSVSVRAAREALTVTRSDVEAAVALLKGKG